MTNIANLFDKAGDTEKAMFFMMILETDNIKASDTVTAMWKLKV